jgi:hypothetical protein
MTTGRTRGSSRVSSSAVMLAPCQLICRLSCHEELL